MFARCMRKKQHYREHAQSKIGLAALLLRLGLVHVRDLLTEVEGRARAVLHALDLHDVLVLVLGRGAAALEAADRAFHVEPHRLHFPRFLLSRLHHRQTPTALTSHAERSARISRNQSFEGWLHHGGLSAHIIRNQHDVVINQIIFSRARPLA